MGAPTRWENWLTRVAWPFAVTGFVQAMACVAPTGTGLQPGDYWAPALPSVKPRIELAYVRDLPCKNWSSALEIAKRISGCGAWGT